MFKKNLSKGMVDSTFSVFHNNIASISRNLENVSILLDEFDFPFNVYWNHGDKNYNFK